MIHEQSIFKPREDPYHRSEMYQTLKGRLHTHVVSFLDDKCLSLDRFRNDQAKALVRKEIALFLDRELIPLNQFERDQISLELIDELIGFGPLDPLLMDDSVNDILVNRYDSIYVERRGGLELSDVRFIDEAHMLRIIQRIVAPLGRRVDESSPMIDARLPDGSRINIVIPPLSLDGPAMSIRKFRAEPLKAGDLLAYGTLNEQVLEFLRAAVEARCNILVVGGTGSGKTTILNVISSFISKRERVITIEDAAELRLLNAHVVRLETRPPSLQGAGEVTSRDLLRNSLRMRPDRIILGEVRGSEAVEMLQAMNTGHDGSMATLHANSPREALHRLELLLSLGGFQLSERNLRYQIASAIDLIIHVSRLSDGARRLLSVSEVTGAGNDVIYLQELFKFEPGGKYADRAEGGVWTANNVRPNNRKLAKMDYARDDGEVKTLGIY